MNCFKLLILSFTLVIQQYNVISQNQNSIPKNTIQHSNMPHNIGYPDNLPQGNQVTYWGPPYDTLSYSKISRKLPHMKYDNQERPLLSFGNDGFIEDAGDRAARQREFPYHVQLRLPKWGFFCGGTLVRCPKSGRQIVVTAAHCVCEMDSDTELNPINDYTLHVGILGVNDNPPQSRKVILQVVHPGYKIIQRQPAVNDIAILVPDSEFEENDFVQAIPLNNSINPPRFDFLTVVGWGKGREAGNPGISSVLRVVEVPLWDNEECNRNYFKEFGINMVNDDHLCAGYKYGGLDACQGDSGSGAVVKFLGKTIFAGVVSWGRGCGKAGLPGIYVKVSAYVPWLLATTEDIFKHPQTVQKVEY